MLFVSWYCASRILEKETVYYSIEAYCTVYFAYSHASVGIYMLYKFSSLQGWLCHVSRFPLLRGLHTLGDKPSRSLCNLASKSSFGQPENEVVDEDLYTVNLVDRKPSGNLVVCDHASQLTQELSSTDTQSDYAALATMNFLDFLGIIRFHTLRHPYSSFLFFIARSCPKTTHVALNLTSQLDGAGRRSMPKKGIQTRTM